MGKERVIELGKVRIHDGNVRLIVFLRIPTVPEFSR